LGNKKLKNINFTGLPIEAMKNPKIYH